MTCPKTWAVNCNCSEQCNTDNQTDCVLAVDRSDDWVINKIRRKRRKKKTNDPPKDMGRESNFRRIATLAVDRSDDSVV